MKLDTPEISWHGRDPVYSLDVQTTLKHTRLATGGADNKIRIWYLTVGGEGKPWVEFASNLSRHTKAVNVVRFSATENILASAGDESVIYLWKLQEGQSGSSFMDKEEEIENKENWTVLRMLRGHLEDVYDLCWSKDGKRLISGSVDNSAIVWDVNKGERLLFIKDHKHYVQGVAFDPQNQLVATFSCDRSCRVYNLQSKRCVNHITKMPINSTNSIGEPQTKQVRLFHDDDSLKSFFRRLSFSPDGEFLIVPCGFYDNGESTANTTFLFSRSSLSKPVLHYPGPMKLTVAVRCCPVLFELRNKHTETTGDNNNVVNVKINESFETMENGIKQNKQKSDDIQLNKCENSKHSPQLFSLGYRMVFAVASEDSVILYDTEQITPFALISKIHYQQINDLAWSSDGQYLVVCSTDGYCTVVAFEKGELGVPYKKIEYVDSLDKTAKAEDSPTTNDETISLNTRISTKTKKQETINHSDSPRCAESSTLNTTSLPRQTPSASLKSSSSETIRDNQTQKRRIPLTALSSAPTSATDSEKSQPRRIQLTPVPNTSLSTTTTNVSSIQATDSEKTQLRRIQLTPVPSTSLSTTTTNVGIIQAGNSSTKPQAKKVQLSSVPETSSIPSKSNQVEKIPEITKPRRVQLSSVPNTPSTVNNSTNGSNVSVKGTSKSEPTEPRRIQLSSVPAGSSASTSVDKPGSFKENPITLSP